jgi:hypothetical protein
VGFTPIVTMASPSVNRKAFVEFELKKKGLPIQIAAIDLRSLLRPENAPEQIMHETSRKAQDRGLTPEILESILHES